MQDKKDPQKGEKGALYVVSTPIGNQEDITLRALRVLESVDLIAAEGVRHSRKLCRHHGIKTRLISYNQHNWKVRGPELIGRLKAGLDIAIVTNAGTPGVSDPGGPLVARALAENIKVVPVPGPSAAVAALSVSGFRSERFLFLGFLSSRSGQRKGELEGLRSEARTMVFFEAPHRLQAMLRDLKEILGDRQIVVLREMTKVYEEVKRGPVSGILQDLEGGSIKGEITLVVAGRGKDEDGQFLDKGTRKEIERMLREREMRVRDIAAALARDKGLSYRRLYKECLSMKRAMESSHEMG